MLIPIKKIESHPAKDATGAIKKIPNTDRTITEKRVVDEGVDVWLIKAVRPFHKGNSYKEIDGDVAVMYLRPSEGKAAVEVHVVGNWMEILTEVNKLRGGRERTGIKADPTNIVS